MEKVKKQKVRYEYFTYTGTVGVLITQVTLKIENPASVTFTNIGPTGNLCIINNVCYLAPLTDYITGVATLPYYQEMINNQDEIDVTNYSIKIIGGGAILVKCKYYIYD